MVARFNQERESRKSLTRGRSHLWPCFLAKDEFAGTPSPQERLQWGSQHNGYYIVSYMHPGYGPIVSIILMVARIALPC